MKIQIHHQIINENNFSCFPFDPKNCNHLNSSETYDPNAKAQYQKVCLENKREALTVILTDFIGYIAFPEKIVKYNLISNPLRFIF